jgi:cell division protease FtsH
MRNISPNSDTPQEQEPDGKQRQSRMRRMGGALVWLILGLVATVWLWNQFMPGGEEATEIAYSQFRRQVREENVTQVTMQGQEIRGELRTPAEIETESGETEAYSTFRTFIPPVQDDSLLPLLEEQGVQITTQPERDLSILAIFINLLPFLLLIAVGYFIFSRSRQQGQRLFNMGQSQATLYDEEKERTTFDDVAGLDGPKTELEEIIAYLKSPERVQRLGGNAPKGILLVGPPGTGKTLLARAVAGEAEVPFFSITGSDFMEMFVGVGASRVRELFKDARQAAPCIIFIDELDSIGRRRGAGLGGGHDEREQTLNQLLSELDGFEPSENVVVIAATNRPDILDPALLRPGRFDRRITVNLPTVESRREILQIHARNKPLADEVELDRLAQGTAGFSGADLENLLNEAALLAARHDRDAIMQVDIEEARDKIMMGLVREGMALTDEECELIAYHEAGHALTAALLPHTDPIHKVTIVPRGQAMGVTQQMPEKEKYIYPREYLQDRLTVMMGGRAAEALIFDTATSGAANDLKQATQLARKMVLDWGMSDAFGFIAFGGQQQQVFLGDEIAHQREYSERTARDVDKAVHDILEVAYERATQLLQEYKNGLDDIAAALLEQEEVTGDRVFEILGIEKEPAKLVRKVTA